MRKEPISQQEAVEMWRIRVKPGDFLCIQRGDTFRFGKVRSTNGDGWALSYLDHNEAAWQCGGARTWVVTADCLTDPVAFWSSVRALGVFEFPTLCDASAWARPFLKDWSKSKRNASAFIDRTALMPEAAWVAMLGELDDATVLAVWFDMCKGIAYGAGVRLRNLAWDVMAERTKVRRERTAAPKMTGRRVMGVRRDTSAT